MGSFKDWLFMKGDYAPRDEAEAPAASAAEEPDIVRIDVPFYPLGMTAFGYGALMSVDYAACEQTKARSLASLPVSVIRNGKNREKVDHPIASLLNGMANEEMTGSDLLNWHRLRCDTFGNAYWRVEWWKGQVVAIWPMTGNVLHRYEPGNPPGRRTVYDYGGDVYTKPGRYFSDEVVNIKTHITKDGMTGVSLAKLAAEQIGLSVDLERFYKSMLQNGNHHFGHVEIDRVSLPDNAL
ncbi:MAG: phage portal protein, partial [Atopobiaceae bacterium]|nr:phage portal protein [Atopobiaceae bacterium]